VISTFGSLLTFEKFPKYFERHGGKGAPAMHSRNFSKVGGLGIVYSTFGSALTFEKFSKYFERDGGKGAPAMHIPG